CSSLRFPSIPPPGRPGILRSERAAGYPKRAQRNRTGCGFVPPGREFGESSLGGRPDGEGPKRPLVPRAPGRLAFSTRPLGSFCQPPEGGKPGNCKLLRPNCQSRVQGTEGWSRR